MRKKIDDVFEKLLKIPSLDELRELLNREPFISAPADAETAGPELPRNPNHPHT